MAGMPVLPGYWWDETRKRYFKGTRPPSPSPPPVPIPQPSISSLIRRREAGHDTSSALTSRVLAKWPPIYSKSLALIEEDNEAPYELPMEFLREEEDAFPPLYDEFGIEIIPTALQRFRNPFHYRNIPPPSTPPPLNPTNESLNSALLHTFSSGKIALLKFPTAQFLGSAFPTGNFFQSIYCPVTKKFIYLEKHRYGNGDAFRGDTIHWVNLPGTSNAPLSFSLETRIQHQKFAISSSGHVGLACELSTTKKGMIQIFNWNAQLLRMKSIDSSCLCMGFLDENVVCIGTRSGSVQVWDSRENPNTSIIRTNRRKNASVYCLVNDKDGGHRIFAASWGNQDKNLVSYDVRYLAKPVLEFNGHMNVAKDLKFDVGKGLLVAGGDDGIVRFWDSYRGGNPLDERSLGGNEIAEKIQFANERSVAQRPGIWICTNSKIYSFES